jgi:hypothetical protein
MGRDGRAGDGRARGVVSGSLAALLRHADGYGSRPEGTHAMKKPHDTDPDLDGAGHPLPPSLVLVQSGAVIGTFGPEETEAADRAVTRHSLAMGRHVDVYEVDAGLPPPPPIGSKVDPALLRWVRVG